MSVSLDQARFEVWQLASALHDAGSPACPGEGTGIDQDGLRWSCVDCTWSFTLELLVHPTYRERRRLRRAVRRVGQIPFR